MFRGTTPAITIHCSQDLTGWELEVDVKCGETLITKTDAMILTYDNVPGCYIVASLSQQETLEMEAGKTVKIQLRGTKDGTAIASDVYTTTAKQILRDGLIPITESETEEADNG